MKYEWHEHGGHYILKRDGRVIANLLRYDGIGWSINMHSSPAKNVSEILHLKVDPNPDNPPNFELAMSIFLLAFQE